MLEHVAGIMALLLSAGTSRAEEGAYSNLDRLGNALVPVNVPVFSRASASAACCFRLFIIVHHLLFCCQCTDLLYLFCTFMSTPSFTSVAIRQRRLSLVVSARSSTMTMGSNAAALYAPNPTPPACAGGGHRVSRQAEVEDEAMSVWLRHRCLRSPQRSLDARRPSWWGGSNDYERQRTPAAPAGAWLCNARLPYLLTLSHPYLPLTRLSL